MVGPHGCEGGRSNTRELNVGVFGRSGRNERTYRSNRELVTLLNSSSFARSVTIQSLAKLAQQRDVVLSLLLVLWVLKVDVQSVPVSSTLVGQLRVARCEEESGSDSQSKVLEKLDARFDELSAALRSRNGTGKVTRVSPATDGDEQFEVSVLLLEQVERFEVAVCDATLRS